MTVAEQSRPGTPADAVDGVTPRFVAEPASGRGLRRGARGRGRRPARHRDPRRRHEDWAGAGRWMPWIWRCRRPGWAICSCIATAISRRPCGAGVPLSRLNTTLAARGQWLPVDSAFAATTVGGMLATNDSGPLRHRFGTPRDLLIGITLALTDGRVVKAGGTVVKNVAGYDLGKLVTGSYGALAAIVDATFKLLPLPHASATLRAVYSGSGRARRRRRRARGGAARAARLRRPGRRHARRAALVAARPLRLEPRGGGVAARRGAGAAARRHDRAARRHGSAAPGPSRWRCRGTARVR